MKRAHTIATLTALFVFALVAPSASLARPLANHSAMYKEMDAAINELAQKSGDAFEIAYVNMIIPHHEDAIKMADMVVNDAPHQETRAAAAKIIQDQRAEIAELTSFLKTQYGQDVQRDDRMMMDMTMMDMMMQADATMCEQHFLAMMREHHQSAIDIGELVVQKATSDTLLDQAQKMIRSQQEEQEQFGTWLQQWYGITPPTPTGDMQDGMDAMMPMGLPATGAADTLWAAIVAGALALLAGGYMLRRTLA